jgi:PIN domain nuclease of toxin-antitoxin system
MLIIVLAQDDDELTAEASNILTDAENIFYISTTVVRELFLQLKEGNVIFKKYKTAKDVLDAIDFLGYEIKPVTRSHLLAYYRFEPYEKNKDPNDHIIVSQAISDKIPLISTDGFFRKYQSQGLDLVFNRR